VKVAIIGAGQVGSAAAFTLTMERFVSQVVLIDRDRERARAEAMDIAHAYPMGRRDVIFAGDYGDIADAGIVIVSAGANQQPGQSRLDLLAANVGVCKKIIPAVAAHAPQAILLIATNPMDVLVEVAQRLSQFPPQRVIGSVTSLDSARFRVEIARFLDVSPMSVQACVIGEHGDSAVPVWSRVTVESIPLEDFAKKMGKTLDAAVREHICQRVRHAAYEIIGGKGASYYGIAGTLSRICRRITLDEQNIIMLSTHHDSIGGARDIAISTPVILGRAGSRRVFDFDLAPDEEAAFADSVAILEKMTRAAIDLL
jgi:L-lactate dehydrogenase